MMKQGEMRMSDVLTEVKEMLEDADRDWDITIKVRSGESRLESKMIPRRQTEKNVNLHLLRSNVGGIKDNASLLASNIHGDIESIAQCDYIVSITGPVYFKRDIHYIVVAYHGASRHHHIYHFHAKETQQGPSGEHLYRCNHYMQLLESTGAVVTAVEETFTEDKQDGTGVLLKVVGRSVQSDKEGVLAELTFNAGKQCWDVRGNRPIELKEV